MERPKSQIVVDKRTETVLIRNLIVKDHEVFEVISDQKDLERAQFIKRAIKERAHANTMCESFCPY
jgi:hypothetical protein